MSEYTSYYAVKSTDIEDVKQKLNQAKVVSIVEADEDGEWFSDNDQRDGHYNWVIVATNDEHIKLSQLFSTMLMYNQDEDFIGWDIEVYHENNIINKRFYPDEPKELITADEQKLFEQVFDKPFVDIQHLLAQGKGGEFLNTVGIPYMEMLDQGLFFGLSPIDDKYALSFGDFDD